MVWAEESKTVLALTDDDVDYYYYGWNNGTQYYEASLTGAFDGDTENAFSDSKDQYLIIDLKERKMLNGMEINLKSDHGLLGLVWDSTVSNGDGVGAYVEKPWSVYVSSSEDYASATWTSVFNSQNWTDDATNKITIDMTSGTYRYIMIGCSETLLDSWVNSWNQFTEITLYSSGADVDGSGDGSGSANRQDKIDLSSNATAYKKAWNGTTEVAVDGLWDGITDTAAISESTDNYLILNLNSQITIDEIKINLKEDHSRLGYQYGSTNYYGWSVYGSADNTTWTTIWASEGTAEAGESYDSNSITIAVGSDTQYRYLMFGATGQPNNWAQSWDQFAEIALYGTVEEDDNSEDTDGSSDSDNIQVEIFSPNLNLTDESVDYYYYGWTGSGTDFTGLDLAGMFDGNTENCSTKGDGTVLSADTYLIIDLQQPMTLNGMRIHLKDGYSFAGEWSVYGIDTEVEYNQLSKAEKNWDVLYSWDAETSTVNSDNAIEADLGDGSYRYLMIGCNQTFMGSWTHSWDQFTEITLYGGTLDLSNKVNVYTDEWNGYTTGDVVGLWDGNTTAGLTNSAGESISKDSALILDLNSQATINKVKIALKDDYSRLGYKNDGTYNNWGVYVSSDEDYQSASWTLIWESEEGESYEANLITIEVDSGIQCRHIRIGAEMDPANKYTHSWDQFAELTVYGTRGDLPVTEETQVDLKKPTLNLTDDSVAYSMYGWDGSGVSVYDSDLTGVFDGDTENVFSTGGDQYLIIDLKEPQTINGIQIYLKSGYSFSKGDWAVYGSSTDAISTAEADWKKLFSVDEVEITDNTIEATLGDGSYRYLMIGGSGTFMSSYVDSWNQFTEITIYGGILDLNKDVDIYTHEWNGFTVGDIVGVGDGNTTDGLTNSAGESHAKDSPMILDLNSISTVNKVEISLKENHSRLGYKNDGTYNSWGVYVSTDEDYTKASWTKIWESNEDDIYESNLVTVEFESDTQCRYIRIGASPDTQFTHSWDQFTEITVYGTRGTIIDPFAGDVMKDWSDWTEKYGWDEVTYNTVTATIANGASVSIDYLLPSTENTTVVFTSDDLNVVTVDTLGNITAIGKGTARVTATVIYDDGTVKEYGSYLTKVTVN